MGRINLGPQEHWRVCSKLQAYMTDNNQREPHLRCTDDPSLWWHKCLDCSYLWGMESPTPLLGKEDFNRFTPGSTSLRPLQGVLSEGHFIQTSGVFLSAFSFSLPLSFSVSPSLPPCKHGALVSHCVPSTNIPCVWNPVLEVTVSKDIWYLSISSVRVCVCSHRCARVHFNLLFKL